MRPDLSLVIPAFDESVRLPETLAALERHFASSDRRVEIVVVDDGSTDDTAAIAAAWVAAAATDRLSGRTFTISHRGKGAAVRAGMRSATGGIVGYCDADTSASPEAIDRLYERCAAGIDVALSSRTAPGAVIEVRQPWYRENAGHLFNFFLRKLARLPYRDTQCGLKMFRAGAAQAIFRHQRLDGFAFDAEVIVLARELGFRLEEAPIHWRHSAGSKVSMLRDSFAMARDLFRIVRRLRASDLHAPGELRDDALERMVEAETVHWWHRAKRNLVTQVVTEAGASGPCLDVGCGGGALLNELPLAPVFGTDVSGPALQHAQRFGRASLVQAEGDALPFRDATMGCALALDVIEHHARPEDLLADTARVLRAGGLVVITVPAFDWMWSYADHVLGHYRRYTKRRLETDLRTAGFDVVRVTYFHSWLLPVAWLFRRLKAVLNRPPSADDFPVPDRLNRALLSLSEAEARVLSRRDLPFGLSVLAVGRKPAG
jgi:dolichyl-phosphate beta-glucosyltransferase